MAQQFDDVARTPSPQSSAVQRSVKRSRNGLHLVIELVLIAGLLGVSLYALDLRSKNTDLQKQVTSASQNPQAAVDKQTKEQIEKVSKLIELPADEQPTIASVSDPAKAKAQSNFFKDAQLGDTVFMYVKSGQAILYRPSTNRIVLVAPLTFDSTGTSTTKR